MRKTGVSKLEQIIPLIFIETYYYYIFCISDVLSECIKNLKHAELQNILTLFLNLIYLPGETSRTPLSPALTDAERGDRGKHLRSDVCMDMEGDYTGEGGEGGEGEPPRLQRCKAQSRNTFRLRRSRRNRVEVGCDNTNMYPMK